MPDRHDALAAAAELIYRIERLALQSSESPDLVATVGRLDVHPGAVNSIPSRVQFTLDLRDIDLENREAVWTAINNEAKTISERRDVGLESQIINADPPASADPQIMAAVRESAVALGYKSQEMISRAYHDSLFMARIAPTGMIFIPCRDGVSHRPDEYATPEDIAAGVAVLGVTLAKLAE